MRSASKLAPSPIRDYLTNDILVSIFDRVSIVHRKRLSRVCKRWKQLIDVSYLWVKVYSAVDDRRCVANWQPFNWIGLKFVSTRDYIRIPKVSASEVLSRAAAHLPNLRAIDLECCDMNNRIIRTILSHCKRIERLNLDSSTRLNFYSFNLMVQDWHLLKHVNLSCCTDVNEVSVKLIIEKLHNLESLNVCGTRISGNCLRLLNKNMLRLDISYCWGVQEAGLSALAQAPCLQLEELSLNNFDFEGSERCLIGLCNKFVNLKHLQMSIGPCVAHDYFIDRLTHRGFMSIAKLTKLETLIIEKVCIMDNRALDEIIRSCKRLKHLKLNLKWLNMCNDEVFLKIYSNLLDLEELHIMYPASFTSAGLVGLSQLRNLRALSLINTTIDNDIFKHIERLDKLTSLNLDECRKVTIKGLNILCRIASRRAEVNDQKLFVSLLSTGITIKSVKAKRNRIPQNLFGHVSNFMTPKTVMQLPPVI